MIYIAFEPSALFTFLASPSPSIPFPISMSLITLIKVKPVYQKPTDAADSKYLQEQKINISEKHLQSTEIKLKKKIEE